LELSDSERRGERLGRHSPTSAQIRKAKMLARGEVTARAFCVSPDRRIAARSRHEARSGARRTERPEKMRQKPI
jgi:hypothetical protein